MPTKVAIHGAAGRMGQRLIALAWADANFNLVAAHEAPDHPTLGQDAGLVAGVGEIGIPISCALTDDAEVIVDFSVPQLARVTSHDPLRSVIWTATWISIWP